MSLALRAIVTGAVAALVPATLATVVHVLNGRGWSMRYFLLWWGASWLVLSPLLVLPLGLRGFS